MVCIIGREGFLAAINGFTGKLFSFLATSLDWAGIGYNVVDKRMFSFFTVSLLKH
jgi:hypothetical protein